MSRPIFRGIPICHGARPQWLTLPISNLPPDAVSIKRSIRNTQPARATVRTETGVTRHLLINRGEHLELAPADWAVTVEDKTDWLETGR